MVSGKQGQRGGVAAPKKLPTRFTLVAIIVAITTAAAAVTTTTAAATTTITASATAATVSSRLGFVNGQIATAEVFTVECLDCCCCFLGGCHLHKSKAA